MYGAMLTALIASCVTLGQIVASHTHTLAHVRAPFGPPDLGSLVRVRGCGHVR